MRLFPHSLSINLLARRRELKFVYWMHASKCFKSKLTSFNLGPMGHKVSVALNKLGGLQNSAWQNLISQQWKS
ncbi:MAG: hypothetical protein AAI902_00410 [Candidatus Hodgkinia cicadicola]